MSGFVKIYDTILMSSVWLESPVTRIVWITMLTKADPEGFVEGTLPGLAHAANVTITECEQALAVLSSPDPHSKDRVRSPEHAGRRVEVTDGGWQILNYRHYRELRTKEQVSAAERAARYRRKHRDASHDERDASHESREVRPEVEVEVENNNSPPRARDRAESIAETREPGFWPEPVENFLRSLKQAGPWTAEFKMWLDGGREFPVTMDDITAAVNDYVGNSERPNLMSMRAYIRRAFKARKLREMEGVSVEDAVKIAGGAKASKVDRELFDAGSFLQRLVNHRDPLHPHTLTAEGWKLVPFVQREAIKAIGGIARVLNARPDQWPWVVRDYITALRGAK